MPEAIETGRGCFLRCLPVTSIRVAKLRGTLTRKRRQHGVQEEPVIVAVLLVSGFIDDEDIARALLGDIAWQFDRKYPSDGRWVRMRNGFWMQNSRARGTRISAVLTANGLMPQNAGNMAASVAQSLGETAAECRAALPHR